MAFGVDTMSRTEYVKMLAILIVLSVLDTVLVAVVFFYYTDTYANYINQAGGFIYAFVSTGQRYFLIRAARAAAVGNDLDLEVDLLKGEGEESRSSNLSRPIPRYYLVLIGFLNGTSNFFLSVGQVHVRGETQSIMSLVGVPLVMILSWAALGRKPTFVAIGAATLIVIATATSAVPSMIHPEDDGVVEYWYSTLLFLLGQVFLAVEKVTEESVFERYTDIDVLRMFQWTMWVQSFLYFAYYPVQSIPAMGGLDIADLPAIIRDGFRCTFASGALSSNANRPHCDWRNPFFFFTYTVVDYCCYAYGLYVIQKGGANLMVLASAIAVPLSNLIFCVRPIMMGRTETFHVTDAIALVLAVVGFVIYEKYGQPTPAEGEGEQDEQQEGQGERPAVSRLQATVPGA
jgi:hypothetical protein